MVSRFLSFFQPLLKSYNVFCQVKSSDTLRHLTRKNAFDEGSERDRYTGEASGKTPELKTPSPGLKTLEKALESNLTPPPIGMQTVVCLFQKGFFLICCKASELNALS